MSLDFSFFIPGTPAPGGSKNAFAIRRKDGSLVLRPGGTPVINVTDAGGKGNKDWRKACAFAARAFMAGAKPFECPVEVAFTFYMLRPKKHFRTGRYKDQPHRDAPTYHLQTPDALKLARSTEDALTGIVWADDCANISISSRKEWTCAKCESGCRESGCLVTLIVIQ